MTNTISKSSRKNAPTARVKMLLSVGAYIEIGEYIVSVSRIEPDYNERGGYSMTTHRGEMPAHHRERFDTLQETANAMQAEADLRKWCYAEQW